VPRGKLLEALRSDFRVIKVLHQPALYLSGIDRTLNLDRVLYSIEKGLKEDNDQEFITWRQFAQYFVDQGRAQSATKNHGNQDKIKLFQARQEVLAQYLL